MSKTNVVINLEPGNDYEFLFTFLNEKSVKFEQIQTNQEEVGTQTTSETSNIDVSGIFGSLINLNQENFTILMSALEIYRQNREDPNIPSTSGVLDNSREPKKRSRSKCDRVKCQACRDMVSNNQKSMKAHVLSRTHMNLNIYKCETCPESFPNPKGLQNHYKKVHPDVQKPRNPSMIPKDKLEEFGERWQACFPDERVSGRGQGDSNVPSTSEDSNNSSKPKKPKIASKCVALKCQGCGEEVPKQWKILAAHVVSKKHMNSETYKCEICENSYYQIWHELKDHYTKDHSHCRRPKIQPFIPQDKLEEFKEQMQVCFPDGPVLAGTHRYGYMKCRFITDRGHFCGEDVPNNVQSKESHACYHLKIRPYECTEENCNGKWAHPEQAKNHFENKHKGIEYRSKFNESFRERLNESMRECFPNQVNESGISEADNSRTMGDE
ncbi:unnamed protein product [Caenorhabditis nigoni]